MVITANPNSGFMRDVGRRRYPEPLPAKISALSKEHMSLFVVSWVLSSSFFSLRTLTFFGERCSA